MFRWLTNLLRRLIEALVAWIERCIPEYQPAAWNDGGSIQLNNNCYNYGCDLPTGTYAQPGRASGIILTVADLNSCTAVQNAATADGLKRVDCDAGCGCEECQHLVALALAPGWDYHWYRKDREGRWSHKVGWSPATNLDNSGNLITDPRTADRGAYTVFCGCFCVNKSVVTIN